ncbi:hypothetical protein B296_00001477 [Ensete ventricosum]|uniref:Uncharacterized protein n=1 Tax=Ensete ventricosum TaxID=4639 RepID=A0A427AY27_ENSVE|nr:hypothetical protein B296_00001477 [Ensete ventricosum]
MDQNLRDLLFQSHASISQVPVPSLLTYTSTITSLTCDGSFNPALDYAGFGFIIERDLGTHLAEGASTCNAASPLQGDCYAVEFTPSRIATRDWAKAAADGDARRRYGVAGAGARSSASGRGEDAMSGGDVVRKLRERSRASARVAELVQHYKPCLFPKLDFDVGQHYFDPI